MARLGNQSFSKIAVTNDIQDGAITYAKLEATVRITTGTRSVFHQTSSPLGWTKDTTAALNDSALRIVTGVAGSGGTYSFSAGCTVVAAHTHTFTSGAESASHTHSGTSGGRSAAHNHGVSDPGHTHGLWVDNDSSGSAGGGTRPLRREFIDSDQIAAATTGISLGTESADHTHSMTTGNASVTHTHSGTTADSNNAGTWIPKYNDVIIATKD